MGAWQKAAHGLALAGAIACAAPAAAQEFVAGNGNGALFGVLDEVRFGASFTNPDWDAEPLGLRINGQIFMPPFGQPFANRFVDALLRPRPHLGVTISTVEDGSDEIFGGFTWTFPVIGPVFVEASFGGTLHDGPLDALGCHLLFRESAGAGLNLGPHWRVLASVDHASHAGLCGENNIGLTHIGGYVGYRF